MDDRTQPARSIATAELNARAASTRPLVLATVSFALSFIAWRLVGGLTSVFMSLHSLTASRTALLVAFPVLLGCLARLPIGMLSDRFGGRLVFATLLVFSAACRPSLNACMARRDESIVWPGLRSARGH